MMQLTTHIMYLILKCEGNLDRVKALLPGFALPDVMTGLTGRRQYSHFEASPSDPQSHSYMKFPEDLSQVTERSIKEDLKINGKLAEHPFCLLGEPISLEVFLSVNPDLPAKIKAGVMEHLYQDKQFDVFLNNIMDCSDKYDNKFKNFQGEMTLPETVDYIESTENLIFGALFAKIEEKYNISCDQEFFDELKNDLHKQYSTDLNKELDLRLNLSKEAYIIGRMHLAVDQAFTPDEWPVAHKEFKEMTDLMITNPEKAAEKYIVAAKALFDLEHNDPETER